MILNRSTDSTYYYRPDVILLIRNRNVYVMTPSWTGHVWRQSFPCILQIILRSPHVESNLLAIPLLWPQEGGIANRFHLTAFHSPFLKERTTWSPRPRQNHVILYFPCAEPKMKMPLGKIKWRIYFHRLLSKPGQNGFQEPL